MSDPLLDGIAARIRKILARTEGAGCTPAEAEAAFAKASKLLAEHNLSMEDIAVSAGGEDSETWLEEQVYETGRWSLEDNSCFHILKAYFFVEGYFQNRAGRKALMLFGKAENVAAARHVWDALHAAFDRQWMMYRILNKRPASERRLFVTGMARGFTTKLKDERRAMEVERDMAKGGGGGTALALTSIAEKTALEFKKAHANLGKAKRSGFAATRGSASTFEAGQEAGRNLNLNKSVEGAKQKGIGGR